MILSVKVGSLFGKFRDVSECILVARSARVHRMLVVLRWLWLLWIIAARVVGWRPSNVAILRIDAV